MKKELNIEIDVHSGSDNYYDRCNCSGCKCSDS